MDITLGDVKYSEDEIEDFKPYFEILMKEKYGYDITFSYHKSFIPFTREKTLRVGIYLPGLQQTVHSSSGYKNVTGGYETFTDEFKIEFDLHVKRMNRGNSINNVLNS